MKSVLPLRIASLLAFLSFILHTYLFQMYEPLQGKGELSLLPSFQGAQFSMDVFLQSYAEIYLGYGLLVVVATLIESAMLWRLAAMEQATQMSMRSMVMVILAAELAYAWVMWEDLFLLPMLMHGTMVLLLTMAILLGGPRPRYRAVA
jgi:hypothetical protein